MTDVAVIGGGLAGLSAAIRAAEHGLAVTVLEAGENESYLCNSRLAGGLLHIAFEDMAADGEDILTNIAEATGGTSDPRQAEAMAARSRLTIRWLRSQGVRLVRAGPEGFRRHALSPPGIRRTGFGPWMWRHRAGDVMLAALEAALKKQGGTIVRGARAVGLLMEGPRCTGVTMVRNGRQHSLASGAVVIADGGFQANDPVLQRFGVSHPERCLKRNAGTGVGDGLRMAEEAGAKIVGSRGFYGHLQYRAALTDRRFWPYPLLDVLATEGLVVNGRGERAFEDASDGVALANRIAADADPDGYFAVFDHRIWMGPASQTLMPPNPFLIRAGGTLISSSTVDGLAALIAGGERLEKSIADHNRRIDAVRSELIGTSSGSRLSMPISEPPFYAVPLCAGITYTMSGIAIDGRARVLDRNDRPMLGLFAAGATTAGLEHGVVGGYVGGLSKAAVFGMLAGEEVARHIRTTART